MKIDRLVSEKGTQNSEHSELMFLELLVTSGVVCFKIFHLRISEPLGLCAGNQKMVVMSMR